MEAKKPPCFNRPPRLPGQIRRGFDQQTGEAIVLALSNDWFEDRCVTHDGQGIGPNGENYPTAKGWLPWCKQCRWMPAEAA